MSSKLGQFMSLKTNNQADDRRKGKKNSQPTNLKLTKFKNPHKQQLKKRRSFPIESRIL